MKSLIKHLLLVVLLIFNVSSSAMTTAQMNSSEMENISLETSLSNHSAVIIDVSAEAPCPEHANKMAMTPADTFQSMSHQSCNSHDCSNCNCVNVMSSLIILTASVIEIPHVTAQESTYLASVFPDSPPTFIIRPPIS